MGDRQLMRAVSAIDDTRHTLVVAEVFGPTFQGEGPSLGKRAAFVRLGGCNLHCSWCDTPYTWDASRFDLRSEMARRTVREITTDVAAMEPNIVVVTGGEPLLWQRKPAWTEMMWNLSYLAPGGLEVETNGTIAPTPAPVDRYNVSPKLAHSGDPLDLRVVPEALEAFADLARRGRAVLKVVVRTPEDVREVSMMATELDWPRCAAYVMPEGVTAKALAKGHANIAEAAIAEQLNMTTRLHVLAWGEERGR